MIDTVLHPAEVAACKDGPSGIHCHHWWMGDVCCHCPAAAEGQEAAALYATAWLAITRPPEIHV